MTVLSMKWCPETDGAVEMKTYNEIEQRSPGAARLLRRVQEEIHRIVPGAEIILYGSRARGDAGPLSDWDLLVLVDRQLEAGSIRALRNQIYDVELETDTVLSAVIRTRQEWESSRYAVLPFKQKVEAEGIRL
jgi:predicted nucleotidyltransferase